MLDLFHAWRSVAHIAELSGISLSALAGLALAAYFGWQSALVRQIVITGVLVVAAAWATGIHMGALERTAVKAEWAAAQAAFDKKQVKAATVAAANDQARAATDQAGRAQAEQVANVVETKIAGDKCFTADDTAQLRKLWGTPGRDKAKPAAVPRGIEDLLRGWQGTTAAPRRAQ
jgi:hypothetical protein